MKNEDDPVIKKVFEKYTKTKKSKAKSEDILKNAFVLKKEDGGYRHYYLGKYPVYCGSIFTLLTKDKEIGVRYECDLSSEVTAKPRFYLLDCGLEVIVPENTVIINKVVLK